MVTLLTLASGNINTRVKVNLKWLAPQALFAAFVYGDV